MRLTAGDCASGLSNYDQMAGWPNQAMEQNRDSVLQY